MNRDLLTAIDSLYDCAETEFDYQRAITTLSRYTDDTGYMIGSLRFPGTIKSFAHVGVPDGAIEAVTKRRWDAQSHRMIELFPHLPLGVPIARRTWHSDEECYQTVLHQQTCQPWGIHSEGVCILRRSFFGGIAMSFARLPGQSAIDHELLSRIIVLVKHLRRAIQLHSRASQLEEALILSNNALDLVEHGLVLYGGGGEFLYANAAAQRVFETRDGLLLRDGAIVISNRDARERFAALMAGLTQPDMPLSARSGGYVKVPRGSFRRPYGLMAVPLAEGDRSDVGPGGVAVFLFDPDSRSVPASRVFAAAFDLTPAEARLALDLAQGTSVEGYIESRGVTRNTVKTQLRSLFAKTGTSRQSEMVSVLLRSVSGLNLAP